MLKIRIFVSDIATVLAQGFDRIEVGRAASSADASSQSGTFASLGNVVTLVVGQETYVYTDTTGAVGQWYVSRYVKNAGGVTPGPWSDPFRGAAMGYITAAEFRDYDLADLTNRDGTALTDDQLDRHISTATDMLDAECLGGESLRLTQRTERHRWRADTRRIYPYYRPIVSADAFKVWVGPSQVATFSASELFVNASAHWIEVTNLTTVSLSLFPALAQFGLNDPVGELTYTSGYSAIPPKAKDACALTTAQVLAHRAILKEGLGAVASARIGNYQVSRTSSRGGLVELTVPESARRLLAGFNHITIR